MYKIVDNMATKKRNKRIYDAGGALNQLTGLTSSLGSWYNQAKGIDTSAYEDKVKEFASSATPQANSTAELANMWTNQRYLTHKNKYDITGGSVGGDVFGALASNVSEAYKGYQMTGSPYGAIAFGAADLIAKGVGLLNNKQKIDRLNAQIDKANADRLYKYHTAADNLAAKNNFEMQSNYAAYGGPLYYDSFGDGPTSYSLMTDDLYNKRLATLSKQSMSALPNSFMADINEFAEGGDIKIKPENRGKLTALKKRTGKTEAELWSEGSPSVRKMITFARNARKWQKANGGRLDTTFDNGVTFIGNGGTHEGNLIGGVPMGIAPDGNPNLVEEGEVIYNDYVFSNRLKVPEAVRNKYKLRSQKDLTFAELFKKAKLQKESEERPNDPISKNGLDALAMDLAQEQELVRAEKDSNKKAHGGHLFALGYPPINWNDYAETVKEEYIPEDVPETVLPELPNNTLLSYRPYSTVNMDDYVGTVNEEYIPEDVPFVPLPEKKRGGMPIARMADLFANIGAVASDAAGRTNIATKFDYAPNSLGIQFTPLGDYMPITHFDTNYQVNLANQQAAATRNAILNGTSPNRNAALLAADYNATTALGDIYRRAAEEEYNREVTRRNFNRGTNQFNSQGLMSAAEANRRNEMALAQFNLQQARENENMSNTASGARAQNISALAESIANFGREQEDRERVSWLISKGVLGNYSEGDLRRAGLSENQIRGIKGDSYIGMAANGGKLRKTKKRGLTY